MDHSNKTINHIKQFILAASAWLAIWTGNVISATSNSAIDSPAASSDPTTPAVTSNPALEGAQSVKPSGVPSDLVGPTGVLTEITSQILWIIGIISVIMLIYGGLRYILSGGDAKKVTDAKNTLLYAIIGLIISVLAFAIVRFVLTAIGAPEIAQ